MSEEQYVAEWDLWSTTARVVVRDRRALGPAREAVEAVLSEVDAAANRFDPTSEISRLTESGADAELVSPALADILTAALRGARLSDGAVDPTVGRALVALGYDSAVAGTAPPSQPVTVSVSATWHDVHLDAGRLSLPPGVLLDLGAVGKAHAVDRAAERARVVTGGAVLVAIGGDLRACGAGSDPPWLVEVAEAPDAPGTAWVHVRSGGVATSTTTARTWRTRGGGPAHHVLDPTTGRPACVVWRTATVAAATCVDANTASTATLVKGASAEAWLLRNGLPARLVHRDGTVRALGGWPQRDAA
jgi:thiamine biosynthesis lipoprotein